MWIRGKCNYCQLLTNDNSCVCDRCYEYRVKPEYEKDNSNVVNVKDTMWLDNYGNVSKARYDEVGRRIIVGKDKDGNHILGRIGENGKIQDRQPDYYDW